jgi:hypothetical protein
MIARLMSRVAPNLGYVGSLALFFLPQVLLGVALLLLYDIALWGTDRLLKHTHQPRTSLPYLLLDYIVFCEAMGWYASFGQRQWALPILLPPSLTAFLLVRLTPAVVRARRAAAPDERRRAWRTVIGLGGLILCLFAILATALWLLWWIMDTVNP